MNVNPKYDSKGNMILYCRSCAAKFIFEPYSFINTYENLNKWICPDCNARRIFSTTTKKCKQLKSASS
jgi:DNA-directed RNA polymerase subunit RPC12/RpoP